MTKRYYIPIEHEGEKKVLSVGEKLHREIQSIVEAQAARTAESLWNSDIVLSIIRADRKSKMDLRVAKIRPPMSFKDIKVPPPFSGKITFPAIKNVVSGTIKEMFQNPCAEVPLGTDEDFYLPIRKQAPAVIADPNMYPHKCPRCSAPAYIGFAKVDCSRKSCV